MSNIRFLHIRKFVATHTGVDIAVKGGKTVAFRTIESNNNEQIIEYAVAQCANKENFCRRIGRAVASGRLEAGSHVQRVIGNEGEHPYDLLHEQVKA